MPLPTSTTSTMVLPTSTMVVPRGPSPDVIIAGAIGGAALIVLTAVGAVILLCTIVWRQKQAKAKPSGHPGRLMHNDLFGAFFYNSLVHTDVQGHVHEVILQLLS